MEEKEESFGACLIALEEGKHTYTYVHTYKQKRRECGDGARAGKTYYLLWNLIRALAPFLPCSNDLKVGPLISFMNTKQYPTCLGFRRLGGRRLGGGSWWA